MIFLLRSLNYTSEAKLIQDCFYTYTVFLRTSICINMFCSRMSRLKLTLALVTYGAEIAKFSSSPLLLLTEAEGIGTGLLWRRDNVCWKKREKYCYSLEKWSGLCIIHSHSPTCPESYQYFSWFNNITFLFFYSNSTREQESVNFYSHLLRKRETERC